MGGDTFGRQRHREDHRASEDARLSTGYGDAPIQGAVERLATPGLLRFARNDEIGAVQQDNVPRSDQQTPEGCPYAARCAFGPPRCLEEPPILEAKGDGTRKGRVLVSARLGQRR